MTNCAIHRIRMFFGWAAMFGAISLTALTGWRAHLNTLKETARISDKQDIMYGYMIDSETFPLVILDSEGKVIQWNYAMERLTGISKEEAEKKGLQAIMCDPIKTEKHNHAMHAAFINPKVYNKLTIINCSIKDAQKRDVPVRIAVRVIETEGKKVYAIARVDPESQIVEYGTPQSKKMTDGRIENLRLDAAKKSESK